MKAFETHINDLVDEVEAHGYFCFKAETLKEVEFFEEIQEKVKNGI
tara:strand:+ start:470 stop:607 length:138 start_codon:yes stop_codon:yes gene_type:complete